MGCKTIDVNGPFTLIVLDETVSDPTLTDSLIPVGRLAGWVAGSSMCA